MNVDTPPALLVLCSAQGTQKESALNRVTWTLPDTITPQDNQHYVAIVSLHSFTFVNMYENIVSSHGRMINKLKLMSAYSVAGVAQNDTMTITVPDGHYTITDLLTTINAEINTLHPDDGFFYGFGKHDDHATYPPFKIADHNSAKLTFAPPPLADLGAIDANHLYQGFYMIIDDETEGLMKMLGFLRSDREDGTLRDIKIVQGETVIGFNVLSSGGVYSYPVSGDVSHGLNAFNLSSQPIVLQWEGQRIESRASIDDLQLGSTLGLIPSLGSYGEVQTYEPRHPFKAIITNFNPYVFTLSVVGAHDGAPWDFHGIDWTAALSIEYAEIDTAAHNDAAASGVYVTRHPHLHDTLVDYNLPFSGKRMRDR